MGGMPLAALRGRLRRPARCARSRATHSQLLRRSHAQKNIVLSQYSQVLAIIFEEMGPGFKQVLTSTIAVHFSV